MAQRGPFCALREFVLEGEVEVVALVVVAPGLAADMQALWPGAVGEGSLDFEVDGAFAVRGEAIVDEAVAVFVHVGVVAGLGAEELLCGTGFVVGVVMEDPDEG